MIQRRKNPFSPAVCLLFLCFCSMVIHAQGNDTAGITFPPPLPDEELQVKTKTVSIGVSWYRGSFLTTVPKAEYVRDSYTSLGEVSISFQTMGSKDWQLMHRLPSWGFAFITGNTGSRQYIGNMTALYTYLDLPLLRRGRYTLSLKAGAGPGIVSKPYDVVTNPKNTMIGTRLNAFINAVVKSELRITDKLFMNAGISFMHLSNGGTTLPNLGLNTPGLTAGVRYSFKDEPRFNSIRKPVSFSKDEPRFSSVTRPVFHFNKERVFRLQTSAGIRQASWVGGNHYLINLLQGEAGIRTSPNHYFGAGIQLVYNRSLNYRPSETPANPVNAEVFQAGVYATYEHHFGKLSFPFQVGFYLYNKNLYPVIFQQYGARLAVDKHWNGFVMLKSHLGKADFIHAGFGYKF